MEYNVLIVDDSPAMRSFVRKVLDLSGLPVRRRMEAGNGQEALSILRSQAVDVVLTDLNMPEMDGEELVRHVGADQALRSIPVVIVSTDRTEARIRELLTIGASGYVTKPFLPERLREEIERVLGGLNAS